MSRMSPKGLNVNRSFEGCALRAYKDEVGVITIGYGITNYDPVICKKYFGGPITMATRITQQQAEDSMEEAVNDHYMPAVDKALPGQPQQVVDGGGIFHYNTGAIARASWPKAWVRGDKDAARSSILSWNKAGGRVLAGLTRRRNREWSIIERGEYGPEGQVRSVVLDEKGRPTGEQVPVNHPSEVPPNAVPSTSGHIMYKDVGPEVAQLQKDLAELGLYDGKDPAGTFLEHTEAAVRKFQASHAVLTVDGRVGPATKATLARELDLRHNTKSAVKKVGGGGAVVAGTVTAAKGFAFAKVFFILTGVVLAGVLIWTAIKYRAEIASIVRRAFGKTTP